MAAIPKKIFLVVMLALVLAPSAALVARNIPFKIFTDLAKNGLAGEIVVAKQPVFEAGAILSGQTQSDLAPWLAERMGRPREFYIRLNNSIDFLLGRSTNPNIIVGNNFELYTAEMLRDLCFPADLAFIPKMALGLKRAQEFFVGQRKAFLFVLSPNKAAVQPINVPGYCARKRDERAYRHLVAALADAGVNYIDTEALAQRSASEGMPPWFGQYGQHWNDVGLFYTARDVIDNLSDQLKLKMGRLQSDTMWIDNNPLGGEADTGLLSNFLFDLHPVSPHLKMSLSGDHPAMRLLVVGTSFVDGLVDTFVKVQLTQQLVLYNYFKWIFRHTVPSPRLSGPSLEASEDYKTTLGQVDAILVEVNASALNASHVFRFIDSTDALR